MSWEELDLCRYRIDKIRFKDLAHKFRSNFNMSENKLILLLMQLGIIVDPTQDQELFFVTREEDYAEAKEVTNKRPGMRRKAFGDEIEPDMAVLVGRSPSIALTHEMAKHHYELLISNHNKSIQ